MNAKRKTHVPIGQQGGFTLVEIIVGMVALAIALSILTSVFSPQVTRGLDPIWQTRAVSLSKSLFAEINARKFDENSSSHGLGTRCNTTVTCTVSGSLGPDAGESRASFDDVDDYHGLVLNESDIVGLLGGTMDFNGQDVFSGFQAQIQVFYDQNNDGINDDDVNQDGSLDSGTVSANRKVIRLTVITPGNERIEFASFRDNY